ncbi:MAG: lipid-A-disaccharide synthase-related protein [Nodosilinea sp.]
MGQRVLFLSNGHGEDLNASLILQALTSLRSDVQAAAMPIVGEGQAYRRSAVAIIGPTQVMPSSGFSYINVGRWLNPANWNRDSNLQNLLRDLGAGLVGLIWGQVKAVRRYGQGCDLLFATGDIVPILFAYITGRPFMAFLVSNSSYYEGRIKLPWLVWMALRSPHCAAVFTRDACTAQDLNQRGLAKARFCGYPIMDVLAPTGKDLGLATDLPVVALLPGSRLPEALENLKLLLQLCELVDNHQPIQFVAALVGAITPERLSAVAQTQGWGLAPDYALVKGEVRVTYHSDAFPDILHRCGLALGMAGTAVEQVVGLGKPVIQIIGRGPQFTYPFAEAQMRLLGESVLTVGQRPADRALLAEAAAKVVAVLADPGYRDRCIHNGQVRVGPPGGSAAIAEQIQAYLGVVEAA